MGQPTDEALMAAISSGDKGAFEQLVSRHVDAIHAYAFRLSRSRADADDITQEVFLKVWRKAASFKSGRVKVSTWLHRVAHNTFVDLFRKKKDTTSPDEVPPVTDATDHGTAELDAHIAALPLAQRTAVALCLLGGHSTREAAHIMDSTPRAVESLVARARRTLRQAMNDD